MWLDELADLVRSLRERIEKQGDVLRKNESATRYALVDPVLRALGWDLENPSEVIPEYSPGKGYADYGMMVGRAKPRLIIEAKSLGTPTRQGIDQGITYCISQGIEYFAVTNGEVWEIYEPHRPVPIDEKVITSFGLRSPEHETVLKMLWLWRGNFLEGEPSEPATPPLADKRDAVGKHPLSPSGHEWVPLSQFDPPSTTPPPREVRFPDGSTMPVARWYDLQVKVVKWLQDAKKLAPSDCPVLSSHFGVVLVAVEPRRSGGSPFKRPVKVGALWVDKDDYGPQTNRRIARRILSAAGVDPSTVHVLPRSG